MNSQYVNRIIRACKLDVSLYEEVEADKSATLQAASVVVLSSLQALMILFINMEFIFSLYHIIATKLYEITACFQLL